MKLVNGIKAWVCAIALGLVCVTHAVAQPVATLADRATIDRLPGLALPKRQVALHTPMEGKLLKVHVEEGQRVAEGQKLVEMDRQLQAAVVEAVKLRATSRSALERARLELAEAEIMHEQVAKAFAQDAARQWEVRRAKLRRDLAQVAVEAAAEAIAVAEAELKLEQARLERLTMTAPWEGLVTRVAADPGATVGPSDPIVVLIDLRTLKAEIHLSVDLYEKMVVGKTYKLSAGKPIDRQIEGRLTYASKVIDPASRTFRCVFEIDNPDKAMPAGFPVQLVSGGGAAE